MIHWHKHHANISISEVAAWLIVLKLAKLLKSQGNYFRTNSYDILDRIACGSWSGYLAYIVLQRRRSAHAQTQKAPREPPLQQKRMWRLA